MIGRLFLNCFIIIISCLFTFTASASNYPPPEEDNFILKDFKFHTGETISNLKINYLTVGNPTGQPVLILHGTTRDGRSMLSSSFADELFGPGQPLDVTKYYIILPDSIGTGSSSKPSDGLRASFPKYNYDDMVQAQYRLLTEGLNINHLRLIIGNSMGGMQTWEWSIKYPDFMDGIVPMAATPAEMSSRNWMMRRMLIDAIRNDPVWENGNYTKQPELFNKVNTYYAIATNGGDIAWQKIAPTREKTDEVLEIKLKSHVTMDANDFLYQWDASRDYNPEPYLSKIKAYVLAINSADDERNPASTGLMEKGIAQLNNANYYLIPASEETTGHGTVMTAKLWKTELENFIKTLPSN